MHVCIFIARAKTRTRVRTDQMHVVRVSQHMAHTLHPFVFQPRYIGRAHSQQGRVCSRRPARCDRAWDLARKLSGSERARPGELGDGGWGVLLRLEMLHRCRAAGEEDEERSARCIDSLCVASLCRGAGLGAADDGEFAKIHFDDVGGLVLN